MYELGEKGCRPPRHSRQQCRHHGRGRRCGSGRGDRDRPRHHADERLRTAAAVASGHPDHEESPLRQNRKPVERYGLAGRDGCWVLRLQSLQGRHQRCDQSSGGRVGRNGDSCELRRPWLGTDSHGWARCDPLSAERRRVCGMAGDAAGQRSNRWIFSRSKSGPLVELHWPNFRNRFSVDSNMANPNTVALSPSGRHGPLIGFFERVPIIAGSAVAILGALVMAGWAFNLSFITTPRLGGYAMLPLTALCFVLGGISLVMAVRPHRTATTEAIQQSLAALVATMTVLTLYEYLRGGNPGFDLLLFGDRLHQVSIEPPGRMAVNTAGSFLLFALGLLSVPHDQRKGDLRAQMFATPGLFISLIAVLGYVFGVKGMYGLSQSSGMALTTAICLMILGIGILVAVTDRGVASLLMDEGAAGVLTRRLLPAALLAPIVFGIIKMLGDSAGLYETEFGVSLFAVATILTFVGLVLWSGRVLRDTDKERVDLLALEQQARANAERLRSEAEAARSEA